MTPFPKNEPTPHQEEKNLFEDYLAGEFMKHYHGDKEHYEAAFDGWLANLDGNELIEHGQRAMAKLKEMAEERKAELRAAPTPPSEEKQCKHTFITVENPNYCMECGMWLDTHSTLPPDEKKPLCPYCNEPWSDESVELEAYASSGCETCGPEISSKSVEITCHKCKRLIYKKEYHD